MQDRVDTIISKAEAQERGQSQNHFSNAAHRQAEMAGVVIDSSELTGAPNGPVTFETGAAPEPEAAEPNQTVPPPKETRWHKTRDSVKSGGKRMRRFASDVWQSSNRIKEACRTAGLEVYGFGPFLVAFPKI